MTKPRRSRTNELRILNAIAEALNSAPDVHGALERTLALVAELLGFETGWVWLVDPETGQFYSAATQNLPPYLQEPVRMVGSHCTCISLFLEGKLAPTNVDLIECSRLYPAARSSDDDMTGGLQFHASIPLYSRDRPVGIMNVAGPSWRELSRDELRLLSTIAHQVAVAIERARLAEKSARLARAEERARLAREIHDTLAQGLTAIALHLESALHHLTGDPDRARERIGRALETAQENLEEARRSVLDLRAAPLAGKPLAEALGALARTFTSETGVRVRLRVSGDCLLPLRVEAELYRIAQEALTNIRRHAKATEATVSLRIGSNCARLVVHDNGLGFEPWSIPEAGHGIAGMKERAKLAGGSLRLVSRPGRGTTLHVQVPLAPEESS